MAAGRGAGDFEAVASETESTRALGDKDLGTLQNALYPARNSYKSFGLQIGVTIGEIRNIERQYADTGERILGVLSARIDQSEPLTWNEIDRVLRLDCVGQGKTADDIRREYSHIFIQGGGGERGRREREDEFIDRDRSSTTNEYWERKRRERQEESEDVGKRGRQEEQGRKGRQEAYGDRERRDRQEEYEDRGRRDRQEDYKDRGRRDRQEEYEDRRRRDRHKDRGRRDRQEEYEDGGRRDRQEDYKDRGRRDRQEYEDQGRRDRQEDYKDRGRRDRQEYEDQGRRDRQEDYKDRGRRDRQEEYEDQGRRDRQEDYKDRGRRDRQEYEDRGRRDRQEDYKDRGRRDRQEEYKDQERRYRQDEHKDQQRRDRQRGYEDRGRRGRLEDYEDEGRWEGQNKNESQGRVNRQEEYVAQGRRDSQGEYEDRGRRDRQEEYMAQGRSDRRREYEDRGRRDRQVEYDDEGRREGQDRNENQGRRNRQEEHGRRGKQEEFESQRRDRQEDCENQGRRDGQEECEGRGRRDKQEVFSNEGRRNRQEEYEDRGRRVRQDDFTDQRRGDRRNQDMDRGRRDRQDQPRPDRSRQGDNRGGGRRDDKDSERELYTGEQRKKHLEPLESNDESYSLSKENEAVVRAGKTRKVARVSDGKSKRKMDEKRSVPYSSSEESDNESGGGTSVKRHWRKIEENQDGEYVQSKPHDKRRGRKVVVRETSSSSETDNSSPECDMEIILSESEKKKLVRIFKCAYGKLCYAIKDPNKMAVQLQAKRLLSRSNMDYILMSPESRQVKAISLVRFLHRRIKCRPNKVFTISEVLMEDKTLQEVGTEISLQIEKVFFKRQTSVVYSSDTLPAEKLDEGRDEQDEEINQPLRVSSSEENKLWSAKVTQSKNQSVVSPIPTSQQQQLPQLGSVLKKYQEYLKSCYAAGALAPADKYLSTLSVPYINLAMVSKGYPKERYRVKHIFQSITPISMEDLLTQKEGGKPVKFVLVEGLPGIGKSTFAWEVCRRWGDLESLRYYHTVVLLKLSEEWVLNATSLADLFRYPSHPFLSKFIADEVVQSQGRKHLFVLDGFDEISHSFHKNSVIKSILCRELLPKCSIILTTRPIAMPTLKKICQPRVDGHFEIIEFTENESVMYITEVFKEPELSSVLKKYQEYLKSCYAARALAPADKYLPTLSVPYINLAMVGKGYPNERDEFTRQTLHGGVDQILESKTPISIKDLLTPEDSGRPVRFILVEGPPGIGKSTFAWEVCRRWDEIKSLKYYHTVVLLKLREKWVLNATSLADLLRYPSHPFLSKRIADEVVQSQGRKHLFVLDGFDEISHSFHENSVIKSILCRELLPKCSIILTTRPVAMYTLKKICQPQVDRHVEIIGFTEEERVRYINEVFSHEPELQVNFLKYMFLVPHIKSMMYIPLNCAIIAQVYYESQSSHRLAIPKTRTQLYKTLAHSLLVRHKRMKQIDFESMSNLPEGLNKEDMDMFKSLAKFAFDSYHEGESRKVTFFKEDIPEGLVHFGFMNESTEMFAGKGVERTFSFLHLSLQEYLAAWHLANSCSTEFQVAYYGLAVDSDYHYKGEDEEEKALLLSIEKQGSSVEEPAIFLAGITGWKDAKNHWEMYISHDTADIEPGNSSKLSVLMRSLYEAQNPSLLPHYFSVETVEDIDETLIEDGFSSSRRAIVVDEELKLYDCYALSYCLANLSDKFAVKVSVDCEDAVSRVEIFSKGLDDHREITTPSNVSHLLFDINNEYVKDTLLWVMASPYLSKVEKVYSFSSSILSISLAGTFLQSLKRLQLLHILVDSPASWESLAAIKSCLSRLKVLRICGVYQLNPLPSSSPLSSPSSSPSPSPSSSPIPTDLVWWPEEHKLSKLELNIEFTPPKYYICDPTDVLIDRILVSVLKSNQITKMVLPNISRGSMSSLQGILLHCPITTLELKMTTLGYDGILYICSGLRSNKTLRHLLIHDVLPLPPSKRRYSSQLISFSSMELIPLADNATCTDFLLELNEILNCNTTLEVIKIQSGLFLPLSVLADGEYHPWTGGGPLQQFNVGAVASALSPNLRRSFSSSDLTQPQKQLFWDKKFTNHVMTLKVNFKQFFQKRKAQEEMFFSRHSFTAPDTEVLESFSGLDPRLQECLEISYLQNVETLNEKYENLLYEVERYCQYPPPKKKGNPRGRETS